MTSPDRVIVPLDVPTLTRASDLLDLLPEVTFWKVGPELFVGAGAEILALLNRRGKKIFLDLKFHDIPNTVAGACRAASGHGVDLLTIHATAGRAALSAAKAALGAVRSPPKLLAVTVLTSLTAREWGVDLKIPLELSEYALEMALLSQESGIDGAVCSPREVADLRRVCGADFLLVCPGIRPDWSVKGDQGRTLTPSAAIAAGADYLVIGRPITDAEFPREAWTRICQELAAV